MPKAKSRSTRWNEAVADARAAFTELDDALGRMEDIRQEYDDWKNNLPENLQTSALGEKLDNITELDIEGCTSDLQSVLDEAESMDLPQGFGRD